ncbi:hypothetical protein NC652_011993 [Populus alba x Populus x berolinensis]|nr:hypothetical protein NC652_011993 [Populus alba x Populus x berolinensis]
MENGIKEEYQLAGELFLKEFCWEYYLQGRIVQALALCMLGRNITQELCKNGMHENMNGILNLICGQALLEAFVDDIENKSQRFLGCCCRDN